MAVSTGVAVSQDHHSRLSFKTRRRLFLFLLGAPAVIYVLLVAVWPLAQGVYYSFFDYSLLHPAARHFVGLDNYAALWTDPGARRSVIVTVEFTVAAVGPRIPARPRAWRCCCGATGGSSGCAWRCC